MCTCARFSVYGGNMYSGQNRLDSIHRTPISDAHRTPPCNVRRCPGSCGIFHVRWEYVMCFHSCLEITPYIRTRYTVYTMQCPGWIPTTLLSGQSNHVRSCEIFSDPNYLVLKPCITRLINMVSTLY